jgi:hypothetical protein
MSARNSSVYYMVVDFPGGVTRRQHEQCQIKLKDAQMNYLAHRTEPNLPAFRTALKVLRIGRSAQKIHE